ncbi:unnamed protein product, partial [Nippostrongylus brasiliensis]|uniref:DUF1758 domain-containing protein n=1 Tax=Nippostrongylus brasiliensis TaxID=27835 RepID=A0A0N4YYT6_NIPBR
MYCGQGHRAFACTKYATPQERTNYLREHKLCLICASSQHRAVDCGMRGCFVCQGRHHTSCCFKAKETPAAKDTSRAHVDKPVAATSKGRLRASEATKPKSTPVKQFVAQYQDVDSADDEEDAVAEFHASKSQTGIRETYLPMGHLTIMDPSSRQLRKITALLDTGAECSFIDRALADELNLPTVSATTLKVRTFGALDEIECQTRKVPLEVWDDEGRSCQLELLTHDILTSALRTPPVLDEDMAFIKDNNLKVTIMRARKAKPQILLGSDQLWQLIRSDKSHVRLPSGLHLLPTRLGHLLTGQPDKEVVRAPVKLNVPTERTTSVNAFSMSDRKQLDPDVPAWERYWRMEDDSQEEYGLPDKAVQAKIDQTVLAEFLNDDGESDGEDNPAEDETERPGEASVLTQSVTRYSDVFQDVRSSKGTSIVRIVAYVLRFIQKSLERRNARSVRIVSLSPAFGGNMASSERFPVGWEMERAERMLVKQHQLSWITEAVRAKLRHLGLYHDKD